MYIWDTLENKTKLDQSFIFYFLCIKCWTCAFWMINHNLNMRNNLSERLRGKSSSLCKQSSSLLFVKKKCKVWNYHFTVTLEFKFIKIVFPEQ